LKTSVTGTNTSCQMFTPFTGMRFINNCLLQPVLLFNHPLLQLVAIWIFLKALLHCFPNFIVIGFRPQLLRWPHI